jgi:hypothetical protein
MHMWDGPQSDKELLVLLFRPPATALRLPPLARGLHQDGPPDDI